MPVITKSEIGSAMGVIMATSTMIPKSIPRQDLSRVRGRTSSSHIRMMSARGNWKVRPVSRHIITTNA